jgi:hypothetical protein
MITQSHYVPLRLLNCLCFGRKTTNAERHGALKRSRRLRIGSEEQEEARGEAVLGIGAGEQEVLKDSAGSSQARKVFFSSVDTGIGDIGVPSILVSASGLDTEQPCVEEVQGAAKEERVKRALKSVTKNLLCKIPQVPCLGFEARRSTSKEGS